MINQAHNQLFLLRQALSHQQCQRYQRIVVDQLLHGPRQQVLIQLQIPQKQKRPAVLVAIGKWVVFDDEVQQMRRAAGHVGIKLFIGKTLLNGGNRRGQTFAAQLAEQLGCFALGDQRGL